MFSSMKKIFAAIIILSVTGVAAANNSNQFNFFVLPPLNSDPAFQVLPLGNSGSLPLPWITQPSCNSAGCSYSLQNILNGQSQFVVVKIGKDEQHYCTIMAMAHPSTGGSTGFNGGTAVWGSPGNVVLLGMSYCVGGLNYRQLYNKGTALGVQIF